MQHLHGMVALLHVCIERNQLSGFGIPGLLVDSEISSTAYGKHALGDLTVS